MLFFVFLCFLHPWKCSVTSHLYWRHTDKLGFCPSSTMLPLTTPTLPAYERTTIGHFILSVGWTLNTGRPGYSHLLGTLIGLMEPGSDRWNCLFVCEKAHASEEKRGRHGWYAADCPQLSMIQACAWTWQTALEWNCWSLWTRPFFFSYSLSLAFQV